MLFIDKISFGSSGNSISNLAAGGQLGMIGGYPRRVICSGFCPYSAVLFFAVLLPLALKTTVSNPACILAVGTGLPVLFLGMLLSFG